MQWTRCGYGGFCGMTMVDGWMIYGWVDDLWMDGNDEKKI
jgi:hypothetical protein